MHVRMEVAEMYTSLLSLVHVEQFVEYFYSGGWILAFRWMHKRAHAHSVVFTSIKIDVIAIT